jgi:formylglycine-generating enzyme required for sulfatase activity
MTADCGDENVISTFAWFSVNSKGIIHQAGVKKPNFLGIYDMSGNVWEWCFDWYGMLPKTGTDYRGPEKGAERVVRGGCYGGGAGYLQVGFRTKISPFDSSHPEMGFRFAKSN